MPVVKDPKTRQSLREDLYANLNTSGLPISVTVKQLRKVLAKSQPEFAEFVGISVSALRKIEQEAGNVSLATLDKIFDKFSFKLVVKHK